MEKYCPKPLFVYFNAFPMGQQLFDTVQYIIKVTNYLKIGICLVFSEWATYYEEHYVALT